MIRKSMMTVAVVVILVMGCHVASASIMTYKGIGLHSNVTLHAAGSPADGRRVSAGQYLISYEGTDYASYCVDIYHYLGSGEVTELPIDSLNNGDLVAFLFETYSEDVQDNIDAAALGVAIWEVIFETSDNFDVTDGYLSITGNDAVAQAANDLLSTLPDSYQTQWDMLVLHSDCKQDMIIPGSPIPEPATLMILNLGAMGLIIRQRRRKKVG